jgi:hypothetical protein
LERTQLCPIPIYPIVYLILLESSSKRSYFRVLGEVNERGMLHDEKFGFPLRLSMTMQLVRHVENISRLAKGGWPAWGFMDVGRVCNTV